ncbi:MAG: TauD/TfdA family dioxygenase, partial [Proteobacteria bacterium]|nr:TauD/TfdA family dioxygenase [Pseudomonadota bacterium]
MTMHWAPLSTHLGIEVSGIDLADDNGDNIAGELKELWLKHGGLMVVRDQRNMTAAAHIGFSSRFGPLFGAPGEAPLQDTVSRYIHPEFPEIYRVSNKLDGAGMPLGRKGAGTYWHSDVSFRERPAQASLLHACEIPPIGGDTVFANMTRAYETLSPPMQEMLRPLRAVHDFEVAAHTQYAKPIVVEDDLKGANRAVHPVIRTHADTGKKSLYVNPGFTSHLEGFDRDESQWILEPLYRHAIRPENVYRHRWSEHDLLVWDNRSLMHYAIADYGDAPRYMERTT